MSEQQDTKRNEYVLRGTTMFMDGVDYSDGDVISLDPKRGDQLAEHGLVVAKGDAGKVDKDQQARDDADLKARQEAEQVAADIEQGKVDSALQGRREQAQPSNRRGPGRKSEG